MERLRSKYYRERQVNLVPALGTNNLFEKKASFHPKGLVALARDPNDTTARIGWALCNPMDQFIKSLARVIAYGRRDSNAIIVNIADQQSIENAIAQLPRELRSTALWLIEYENRVINRLNNASKQ